MYEATQCKKTPKHISTEAAYFLTRIYIILHFILGFCNIYPRSDCFSYLGIRINIYTICMIFYFYCCLSWRFQRPFFPCAIITGFVLWCFPLLRLSLLSSLSLLCLEIQCKSTLWKLHTMLCLQFWCQRALDLLFVS